MTTSSNHPLPSLVPAEVRPFQGLRAGLVSRLIADAVDLLVLMVALLACYLAVNGLRFLWNTRGFRFSSVDRPVAFVVAAALLIVYLAVSWATTGRTLGGRVLGLRVVGRGGLPVGWGIAALRALACSIFPIGILWVAVSPAARSVQDVLLRTSVRYDW
jgi:uncharacterized RDD family membrane protein YckC